MDLVFRVILTVSIIMSLGTFPAVSAAEGETGVLHGNFLVVGEPILNQEVELTYFIEPEVDVPDALMRIDLPSGVELVEGNLSWTGSIQKGKGIEMKLRVKAVETGEWQIDAISFSLGESGTPSRLDWDVLIFTVTADEGTVRAVTNLSDIEFAEEKLTFDNTSTSPTKTYSTTSEATIASTVQITGRFTFEDEDDNNIKKPVRNAVVKVKDIAEITWGEGVTDSNGSYSISISVGSPADLHVRVWTDSTAAKVETAGTVTYFGNTDTKTVDPADSSTWDFGEYFAGSTLYQYQIMYYVQEEHYWVQNNALYTMDKVTTIYPSDEIPCVFDICIGDWPRAVWYYILLPDKDTAYWNHYTIYHEYGHMVMGELYGKGDFPIGVKYESGYWIWDTSCPAYDQNQCVNGGHTVNSVTLPGFAIVEGWAEFMAGAIENTPSKVWAKNLGDVDGDGTDINVTSSVNIESNSYIVDGQTYRWYQGRVHYPDQTPPYNTDGNIVEGAAASIWWDIFDSSDETDEDQLTMGYDEIFEILKNDKPQNMNEFWDRWFDTNDNTPTNYGNAQEMWEIYFAQGINKDTTNPTKPTLITPRGTVGTTTPFFWWSIANDDLSGVKHYQIQVDDDIGFGSPAINTTTTSTYYTPPSGVLSNEVTYHWRVGVWDNAGNFGGFSDRWSITIDIKPDLTLQSGDISFSDSSPSDGDNVLISAVISNTGGQSASNVKVRFSHDGTQIGSDYVIASIGAGGSASAWVTWNNVPQGGHTVEVTVDPGNAIAEANEGNNYAEKGLTVGGIVGDVDLTFVEENFQLHRQDYNSLFYVSDEYPYVVDYTAWNKGTTPASNVKVGMYIDGGEVDSDTIDLAGPGSVSRYGFLSWYADTPGRYALKVKIDPQNAFSEYDENNNEWNADLNIMGGESLLEGGIKESWIYESGCSVEKTNFRAGDPICLKIRVYGRSAWGPNDVEVDLFVYRGIGGDNYELLDVVEYLPLEASSGFDNFVYGTYDNVWTLTEKGDFAFYIYVHDGTYEEISSTVPQNAFITFSAKPDLTLSSADITFTPSSPLKGDNVTITASIHNNGETAKDVLVKFYNGDPLSGGLEIGSDTIPIIWAESTGGASMTWENVALGSHSIYVVADPPPSTIDESNEGNNNASKTMSVVNTPPLLSDIPSRSTDEDIAPTPNFIDLYTYASDIEDTDAQLTFSIQSQSNSSLISCTIVSDRYVDCGTPAANQYGSSTVVVKVTDTGSLTDTDGFIMTVNSVNDAPTIPTTLTPASGTYGVDDPIVSITCGGSTDVEGDAVYYNILGYYDGFWHDLELNGDGIYSWDVSSVTSQTGVDLKCSATDLASSSAYFNPAGTLEIDNPPPAITIASPPNATITDTTPDLNFTVDKAVNITYSWNGEGNISGCRNCTSYGTTYGESASETSTSLLLHLNEDFGSTAYDDSGYGNDGSISGATWTTGRFGPGLNFNATAGDNVSVPDAVGLDGVDNLTIMFWAKWDNLGLWKRVLEKTNAYFFALGNPPDGDNIYLQAYNDTGFTFSYASTPLQPDTWYFVAGVYDGSTGQVRMYIDGEDVTAGATGTARGGIRNNPNSLCLGAQGIGCATSDFNGTLDEVHILDRVLNATEIAAYYNRGLSDGQHNVTVYAKDAASNINSSTVDFTVDTTPGGSTPPAITIASPPNATITDTTPDLNFTVDKAVNTTYSWNDEGNISGCRNCTSYGTTYGESAPETSTSLLLHLNEDFGNTAFDDSGYGNDGDISGTSWSAGRFGPGLKFNATAGDMVSISDAPELDGVDNLTIMFWAKWDNLELWKRVLEKSNAYFFAIGNPPDGDKIYLQAYNDTGFTYSYASPTLQPDTWYFVAGVYDGSTGQVRMYIDGEDVTDGATGTARGGIRNNANSLCLGAQGIGCTTSDFNGTLDEVHVLDRALNATEIAAYYNRGLSDGQHNVTAYAKDAASNINSSTVDFTVDTTPGGSTPPAITIASPLNDTITDTTPDLNFTVDKAVNTTYSWNGEGNISGCRNCTSYGTTYGESASETSTSLLLHLNEDFGSTAYDDSGNGNDGSISGATWTTGRFGPGLNFNATAGDMVSISDAPELDGVDNLTVMFWAKWDNLGLWKRVLEKTNAYFFAIGSPNKIYLQAYNDTGFTFSYASTPLQPDTWYFVAGVYDGSTGQVRMYIDGEDVTAGATGTARGGIRNNPNSLCLGAQGIACDTSDFNGTLDEVHVLDRALNATEIAAYYNRGLSDGQHNVTAYAKDTAGNVNSSTKWFTVDTSENTPPIYSDDVDNSGGSILEGDDLSISVYWDDNFSLDTGILRTNKTGMWVNETFKKFTSTPQWFNATIDTVGFGGKTICWNQIANDTSDNWNDAMPDTFHCFEVRSRYVYHTIDETFDREIDNTQPYWWDSITLTGNASANVTDEQSQSGSQSLKINNGNSTNAITMVRYFTTLHGGNITYSVSYYINNTGAFLYYYVRGKTKTGIVKTPIYLAFKNIAGSTSEIGIRDPYTGSWNWSADSGIPYGWYTVNITIDTTNGVAYVDTANLNDYLINWSANYSLEYIHSEYMHSPVGYNYESSMFLDDLKVGVILESKGGYSENDDYLSYKNSYYRALVDKKYGTITSLVVDEIETGRRNHEYGMWFQEYNNGTYFQPKDLNSVESVSVVDSADAVTVTVFGYPYSEAGTKGDMSFNSTYTFYPNKQYIDMWVNRSYERDITGMADNSIDWITYSKFRNIAYGLWGNDASVMDQTAAGDTYLDDTWNITYNNHTYGWFAIGNKDWNVSFVVIFNSEDYDRDGSDYQSTSPKILYSFPELEMSFKDSITNAGDWIEFSNRLYVYNSANMSMYSLEKAIDDLYHSDYAGIYKEVNNTVSTAGYTWNDSVTLKTKINMTASPNDAQIYVVDVVMNSTQHSFRIAGGTYANLTIGDDDFDISPSTEYYLYRDYLWDQNITSNSSAYLNFNVTLGSEHRFDLFDTYQGSSIGDTTPPTYSNLIPSNNSYTSDTSQDISIVITDEGSDVNAGSISMTVAGDYYDTSSGKLEYDTNSGLLTYNATEGEFNAGQAVYVVVNAEDTVGNQMEVTWSFTVTSAGYSISLNQGWNLVSIPLEQDNWSVEAVLASIEGNYTSVYAYIDGAWKFTTARNNPLTDMDLEHGYWIDMTASDTLELTGTVPLATTINITPGWSLVGYPSLTTRNITDVLSGINYTSVYAYIDEAWKFTTARNNPLTEMTPGYGYWIDSNEAKSYEVEN